MAIIVTSERFARHITPVGHPEAIDRADVIRMALKKSSSMSLRWVEPRAATLEELLSCHAAPYIERLYREVSILPPDGIRMLSTGDVTISPASLEIASLAAGAVLSAVDAVMEGTENSAFCIVRPPGHHATPSRGMGFCLFNNVAVGARYLQKKYQIERVLIVDWDVHHGNGTQDIFYDDPSVFYFSTHQKDIYPGTGHEEEKGEGEALGTTLNCQILPGAGSAEAVLKAFTDKLVPAIELFKPQFVFISCGFDAHRDDPLGGLALEDSHFYELTKIVQEIAHKWANDRIVSVLEGGYNKKALVSASMAHLRALCEV